MEYENSLKGKPFLTDASKTDMFYIETKKIPTVDEVRTQEDAEKLLKHSFKLHSILSKFSKASETFNNRKIFNDLSTQIDLTPDNELELTIENQKQTIQKLENEIQSLHETLATKYIAVNNTIDESEAVTETITRDQMRELIMNINAKKSKILGKQFKQHNGQDFGEIYKADFDYISVLKVPKAKKAELTETEFGRLVAVEEKLEAMMEKFVIPQVPQIQSEETEDLSKTFVVMSRDQSTSTEDCVHLTNRPEISDIQHIHSEIFAQLENKFKSEIAAAIKKSTESFKNLSVACPDCPGLISRIDELEKILVDKDHLICDHSSKIEQIKNQSAAKDHIINEAGFQIDAENNNDF